MLDSRQKAEATAKKYLRVEKLPRSLGFGVEGFVFPSMRATAIKVFTHREKFENELAVYRRLRKRKIIQIQGFAIPRLVGFSRKLLVIEMTIVQPPFLVDFSQAKIDTPPDFPEGLEEWWMRLGDLFGDRLPTVQSVFYELARKTGVFYYDLAPRNLNFGDQSPYLPSD